MNIKYLTTEYFWGDGENYPNNLVFEQIKQMFKEPIQANANFVNEKNIDIVIESTDIPKYFQVENDGMFLYYKLDSIKKYQKLDNKYKLMCSASIDLWTSFLIPNWDELLKINFEFSRSPYLLRSMTLAEDTDLKQMTNFGKIFFDEREITGYRCKWEGVSLLEKHLTTLYAVFITNSAYVIDDRQWKIYQGQGRWRDWSYDKDGKKTFQTILVPITPKYNFKFFDNPLVEIEHCANELTDIYDYLISPNGSKMVGKFQGFYYGAPIESMRITNIDYLLKFEYDSLHNIVAITRKGYDPFESKMTVKNLHYTNKIPKPYHKELKNIYLAKYEEYSFGDTPFNMSLIAVGNHRSKSKQTNENWVNNNIMDLELEFSTLFNGQFIGAFHNNLSFNVDNIYDNRANIIKYPQQFPQIDDSYWKWLQGNQNTWDTGYKTNIAMGTVNAFGNIMKTIAGGAIAIATGGAAGTGAAIGGATGFMSGITNSIATGEMMKAKKRDAQNSTVSHQPTTVDNIMSLIYRSQNSVFTNDTVVWKFQKLLYSPEHIMMMNNQLYYKNYYGYCVEKLEHPVNGSTIDYSNNYDIDSESHYYECCGEDLSSTCLKFVSLHNTTFVSTNALSEWMIGTFSKGFRIWNRKIVAGKYINGRKREINEYWTKD